MRSMFSLKILQKVDLVQSKITMPLIADATKVYFVLESRENSSQVVLVLEQASFSAQMDRLKEAKMWDAIE